MVNTERFAFEIERDTGCHLYSVFYHKASSTVEQTIKDIKFSIELKWSFVDGIENPKEELLELIISL